LHVVGRRADGYHLLDSLIAFADIGDRVTAAPAATLSLTLTLGGPEAEALGGLGDDNLVLRAARYLQARDGVSAGAALHLDKHLPAASGIGGGSSDAAATLRALAALWHRPLDPAAPATAAWAAGLGADVPACLAATPLRVGGIGEILDPAGPLPAMGIVLANPRRQLPTATVFRARQGGFRPAAQGTAIPRDPAAFAAMLAECRNDLTDAAIGLVPEIAAMLDRLGLLPGALLARMSGSGATCFALFADRDEAGRAGAVLAAAEPGWWVRAGALLSDQPGV
jgi:4-diphosphocytidyl-2-C-methyl-D-erythritol kinase